MNPIPFQAVQHARSPSGCRPGDQPALLRGDARWVLAARASLGANTALQTSPQDRERLTAWAASRGIAPIHAAAIITIAERAAARGGLDRIAAEAIAALPTPDRISRQDRIFPWLLGTIAVLSAVAVGLVLLRWV